MPPWWMVAALAAALCLQAVGAFQTHLVEVSRRASISTTPQPTTGKEESLPKNNSPSIDIKDPLKNFESQIEFGDIDDFANLPNTGIREQDDFEISHQYLPAILPGKNLKHENNGKTLKNTERFIYLDHNKRNKGRAVYVKRVDHPGETTPKKNIARSSASEMVYHYLLPDKTRPSKDSLRKEELQVSNSEIFPLSGPLELHAPNFYFPNARVTSEYRPPQPRQGGFYPMSSYARFNNHNSFPQNFRDRREHSHNFLGSGNFEVIRGGIYGEETGRSRHFYPQRSNHRFNNHGNQLNNLQLDVVNLGPILGFQGYDHFHSPLYNALSKHHPVREPRPNFADASHFSPTTVDLEAMS